MVWLAFRGWSVLLLAPLGALVAALFAGEPVLAHWTQTFMGGAAHFLAQFFPLFLLGALFGKLMEDSGLDRSHRALLDCEAWYTPRSIVGRLGRGDRHLWRRQLMPAAISLGTMTF